MSDFILKLSKLFFNLLSNSIKKTLNTEKKNTEKLMFSHLL